jgi:hypothetical protein
LHKNLSDAVNILKGLPTQQSNLQSCRGEYQNGKYEPPKARQSMT